LSFIGLGVSPPIPNWGIMISNGYQALQSYPHFTLLSGILLVFTIMSFNFLSDGLRDALDPKMK